MKNHGILFPKVCGNRVPVLWLMFQYVSLQLKQFFCSPSYSFEIYPKQKKIQLLQKAFNLLIANGMLCSVEKQQSCFTLMLCIIAFQVMTGFNSSSWTRKQPSKVARNMRRVRGVNDSNNMFSIDSGIEPWKKTGIIAIS